MKISVKLVAVVSIANIIGIGLLTGVLLLQSQREISRLAEGQTQSVARENGEKISKWFEEYIGAARILARVMEGYKEIPVAQRRDYFNMLMRQVLAATPGLLGMYANWAPNALDGLDADYANTPGSDETGRFISAWTMYNGALQADSIVGFSWDSIIQNPLSQMEYILDPLPEGSILYANMGAPVRDKETGALIGMSGVTIALSTIQTIAEEIKLFGDGHAFVFTSGGVVAAHTDPARLGKNMRESEQDTFGPFLNTVVEAVGAGTAASFSYRSPQSSAVIQYYSIPLAIGHIPQPWTLVVGVSRDTIMAPVYRTLGVSLAIGILTMLLISTGVILMARSMYWISQLRGEIAKRKQVQQDLEKAKWDADAANRSKSDFLASL